MIEDEMTGRTRDLTESFQFIFEGFRRLPLENQWEFWEFFGEVVGEARSPLIKELLIKFSSLLEAEIWRRFSEWLEMEMEN